MLKSIPIEHLQRGRYQPRKNFDNVKLHELAKSIQSHGLIEPLIVRLLTDSQYEIIAGERRWRAAMLAGLTDVPCLISEYTDAQACAVTLIENIQREDLNLIEEATGYQRLLTEFHFSQDDISALVGKSRSHVANIVRLLSLCNEVQLHIQNKQLSLGHARMLVGLLPSLQSQLANDVIKSNWSVRKLEEEVRKSKLSPIAEDHPISHNDRIHLQEALADYMGAPVEIISDSNKGGVLKINFFDNDTLSGLLERMGLRYD